jgi:hypothetical protein
MYAKLGDPLKRNEGYCFQRGHHYLILNTLNLTETISSVLGWKMNDKFTGILYWRVCGVIDVPPFS